MRLLAVVPFYRPAYGFGGPVRSVPALCEALAERGHDVRVATTDAARTGRLDVVPGKEIEVEGVGVTYFRQLRVAGRLFLSPGLTAHLRRRVESFDLVYVYGIWPHPPLAAGAACRRRDVPYVVSPRTGLMRWPLRRRRWLKRLHLLLVGRRYLEGAAAMHYTTEQEREESEELGLDAPGFVVPNPVDLSEIEAYRRAPAEGPADDGFPADAFGSGPTALFLGRLEPRKGLDLTLRALAAARRSVPDARLVVAGPDKRGHRRELEQLARELGVADAVTFTGYLGSRARLEALERADVFVLTSRSENFAVAAVEAMAMGRPALLTEGVGVAPPAAEAGAARVVAPEVEEVRRGLLELLSSGELRDEMGRAAREHARRYEPARVATEMETALHRVLQGRP